MVSGDLGDVCPSPVRRRAGEAWYGAFLVRGDTFASLELACSWGAKRPVMGGGVAGSVRLRAAGAGGGPEDVGAGPGGGLGGDLGHDVASQGWVGIPLHQAVGGLAGLLQARADVDVGLCVAQEGRVGDALSQGAGSPDLLALVERLDPRAGPTAGG